MYAGLELREMEASDMLDVIHYFFEEDMNYHSADQANSHGQTRQTMYRALYGVEYNYYVASRDTNANRSFGGGVSTADGSNFGGPEDNYEEDSVAPFNPKNRPSTKPFVPATELSGIASQPFGALLDSPQGY